MAFQLIPDCIQAATAVGIGLITALAGAIEIHLVVRGEHTILDMGELTPEVIIAIIGVVSIAVALYYHVKGAFCIGLFIGTALYWIFVGTYTNITADCIFRSHFKLVHFLQEVVRRHLQRLLMHPKTTTRSPCCRTPLCFC